MSAHGRDPASSSRYCARPGAILCRAGGLPDSTRTGEQLLTLAQRQQTAGLLLEAHFTLGTTLFYRGQLHRARAHLEQGIALYDAQQHRTHTALYGYDPGVACLCFAAWTLSLLGYLDQALQRIRDALSLAQELSHPHSLVWAIDFGAIVHHMRREWLQTRERAEAVVALASEQDYSMWVAAGTCFRGSALLQMGQVDEAITQIRQGLSFWHGTGAELARPYFMAMLAEAYGKNGQHDEGWRMLAEALELADAHGDRFWEAELYRLRGELRQQTTGEEAGGPGPPEPSTLAEAEPPVSSEAETCLQQALAIARRQQAKSLELRAAMSLAHLWQQQGKRTEARELLAPIYGWFTEGFDTADLQEAKALLEELGHNIMHPQCRPLMERALRVSSGLWEMIDARRDPSVIQQLPSCLLWPCMWSDVTQKPRGCGDVKCYGSCARLRVDA